MPLALRRIESVVPRRAKSFGGKARNLAALARAGFPVPAAFALSRAAGDAVYGAALPPADRLAALLADPASALTEERLAGLVRKVREAPVPEAVASQLRSAMRQLQEDGATALAVRSSSTWEDQDTASAAGLHDTVLGVETEDALLDAARLCWSSLFTPGAISYLRGQGAGADVGGMGLILQAMVPADVAGATFTVNPLSGDGDEMVINASYGLGSAVMDGRVSPDTYRIHKSSQWVRDRVVGDKCHADRYVPGAGIEYQEVEESLRGQECLSEEQLQALILLGLRVESHFDDARDVEWALCAGTLYLLQARPVTALAHKPRHRRRRPAAGGAARAHLVWSNVNVGEALPGVASPLTWSVLSDFSERGFRRAFGALGCRLPRHAELVGNFRGRIYLNLTEIMGIASQVPGLRPKTLLALGGGGQAELLEMQIEERSSKGFLLRLPLTVSRFARENVGLSERVRRFETSFDDSMKRLTAVDLRVLSASGLDRILFQVERLLDSTGQVTLNVYGNLMASVVALKALLKIVVKEDAARLERQLISGLADVESAAPGLTLWHIAQTARTESDVLAQLRGDVSDLQLRDLPEGPTRRALDRFMAAFGHRCAREAEIAEPRWKEDPALCFATLRGLLDSPPGSDTPLDIERRQQALRDNARAELNAHLPFGLRLATRHLLTLVERFTRLRERLRSHVVQVLGLYRAVALDASRRLGTHSKAAGDDGAFYLSVDELHAFLKGDVVGVGPLIRRRRLQLERDRALPDPQATFVGYPPPPQHLSTLDSALKGHGASGGLIQGRARCLSEPSEAGQLKSGEILVAPYADVGWSPLFLVASAVVTDLGGPLSHAAVVAREYGVPMVVNVKHAMKLIETGDEILVDGDAGTVTLLSVDNSVQA